MFAHGQSYLAQKNYHKAINIFKQGCIINHNFKPNHFFLMIAYDILGMQEEVKKEFEILSAITGSRKEMPVVVIWTDKTLADLQANHWKKIISRYS
ncbi:MAG: hypothetical protein CTY35_03740 [Methylotenera sp.]|jgi:tetratricopeptide (TPR) repeat protein|nr:MAG: hypothetical protein CTY35_03740 [Methylotenera sp.]